MGLNTRQKQILLALHDLCGNATLGQVAEKAGVSLNGLSQSVGAEWFKRHVEVVSSADEARDVRVVLTSSDHVLRTLKVIQSAARTPGKPKVPHEIWVHADAVWKANRDGLNNHGSQYLFDCLCWIYIGYVLSDSHHPSNMRLTGVEERIIEKRARKLAEENPYERSR
ncbi:MAG TPA: hypothetical protein VLF21_03260 [Candidatus Saccharimonadales bacterium]|nr:hypothetical protein [Candidatus Saccharimonadales bacterium]